MADLASLKVFSEYKNFVNFICLKVFCKVEHGCYQGSKCPSLPGLTHFKPWFGKVGNTGEKNI